MEASFYGNTAIARLLLEHGANVNVQDQNGGTPLIMAAVNNHTETVETLLDAGAQVDRPDVHGFSPLLVSATKGYLQPAQLLARRGADLHRHGDKGETALSLAQRSNNAAFVAWLREAGLTE